MCNTNIKITTTDIPKDGDNVSMLYIILDGENSLQLTCKKIRNDLKIIYNDDMEEKMPNEIPIEDKVKANVTEGINRQEDFKVLQSTSKMENNENTEIRTERIDISSIMKPFCITERIKISDIGKSVVFSRKKSQEVNEESILCTLCCSSPLNGVIMECGHSGICFNCATKLLRHKKKCPLCRNSIEFVLKIDIQNITGSLVKVIDYSLMNHV